MNRVTYAVGKRLIDIAGASALLLVLGPIALASALAIRAASPGPFLFRQVREGRNGRMIQVLKLRSMHVDAGDRLRAHLAASAAAAAEFAENGCLRDDPRVVGRIGALVRKYSIDELPQLLNVLARDMSLVGPRPLAPADAEMLFDAETRRLRLQVTPGLSGLWQVTRSGKSDIMRNIAELDLLYVRTRSLQLDISILLRTPRAVLSGGGLV